jgi:hypothetical protein
LVLVFLILLTGLTPARYAAADLVAFMLPAIHHVLELPGVAILPETFGEGEAEKVGGLHEGPQREGVERAPLHGGTQQAVEVGGGQGKLRLYHDQKNEIEAELAEDEGADERYKQRKAKALAERRGR